MEVRAQKHHYKLRSHQLLASARCIRSHRSRCIRAAELYWPRFTGESCRFALCIYSESDRFPTAPMYALNQTQQYILIGKLAKKQVTADDGWWK